MILLTANDGERPVINAAGATVCEVVKKWNQTKYLTQSNVPFRVFFKPYSIINHLKPLRTSPVLNSHPPSTHMNSGRGVVSSTAGFKVLVSVVEKGV